MRGIQIITSQNDIQAETVLDYLSIDWLKLAKYLLEECGYDGWGWEFLFHAVREHNEGRAIAYLYRKFNTKFRVPDPTEEVEGISPLYNLFWNLKSLGRDHSLIHPVYDYATEDEILEFFESIDFLAMAAHLLRGLFHPTYRLSHRRLVEWKIIRNDIGWVLKQLPRKQLGLSDVVGMSFAPMMHPETFEIRAFDDIHSKDICVATLPDKPIYQQMNDRYNKKHKGK